jgi:hypothetical protein
MMIDGLMQATRDLVRFAASLGVKLQLDVRVSESWYLVAIKRTSGNPGAGAVVLRALHALADEKCARIGLRASDRWRPGNIKKLIRYYEQFGYVLRSGKDMIRSPRSAWPKEAQQLSSSSSSWAASATIIPARPMAYLPACC